MENNDFKEERPSQGAGRKEANADAADAARVKRAAGPGAPKNEPRTGRRADNPSHGSGRGGGRTGKASGVPADPDRGRGPRAAKAGFSKREPSKPRMTFPEAKRPQAAGPFRLRWTGRDYLLQLSVVILGVMVTFIGSGMIDRWRQARQVRETMHLIVEELAYDRAQAAHVCEKLLYDQQGMQMFDRYGMEINRIPADSLEHYMLLLGAMRTPAFRTDALEVLKSSGVIQSVGDKSLLMQVLGCYREMSSFAENVALYNDRKLEALNHLFAGGSTGDLASADPREAWRSMLADPLCNSFIATSAHFFGNGDPDFFDRVTARVEDTIAAIRDKYGFAYDDTMQ